MSLLLLQSALGIPSWQSDCLHRVDSADTLNSFTAQDDMRAGGQQRFSNAIGVLGCMWVFSQLLLGFNIISKGFSFAVFNLRKKHSKRRLRILFF